MAVTQVNNINITQKPTMMSFLANRREISYGYINLQKKEPPKPKVSSKDKILAAVGSMTGVGITLTALMMKQKIKNPLHVKYKVGEMLTMAAAGNVGGIMLSSIGEPKEDKLKKWKEGAFQMILTSAPMLLVDGAIKLCGKSKSKMINNNFTKILASAAGVAIGSNTAIAVSNKLRSDKEAKKPKRELKLVDMVANFDDFVAICVLARIPFADKIHIERALPVIYSFCGFRSGTGDRR
ncbi:hypothetical protein HDR58_03845 [bacterium]|nr:hypothetical protein [bacterium]